MRKPRLDAEERDLLESFERGEWKPVRNAKQEVQRLRNCARNTLKRDRQINIRVSSKDLDQVQVMAAQEGIPHRTLIFSIIHKYVSGSLVEKRRSR